MMANSFEKARFNMVEQQIRPWEVLDPRVLSLMESLPREHYVPQSYRDLAYADIEVPIGQGQKMMLPRIEAKLMQALAIQPSDKVLEVGTGSGYLTACLANLAQEVVSIDFHNEFTEQAKEKLGQQGIRNFTLINGDALADPLEEGPFDTIAVTGSLPTSQQAEIFRQQLNVGGRLFVVIGTAPVMECMLITRHADKIFQEESILETELAPLINAPAPVVFEF
ncbi:MAG: protein-L-isoaspartate O-methyltransferase [Candidatus Thiodiazotropha taylori]|nr:protein-L-isoaspartate O-methyltransferase [Candidatus Thiodiazotropha taylori]MCW4226042.1 protein-L-isoaspartate O-methyltransferase [Candidatus Thiodiazotropha endolucinida]MCG7884087.1 protein-L-isoaspartate O-methyltransferase [Candidatus Thiodiazotropha taylori]MCG7887608.1 protein-L-isoaspartate O-methyltransferase [Candidatus Thiodiazotropha taylori]MCG7888663.1 protein-L-isoaspartate O-methyltransferase [Candidatus Thiodiazotropha taylori]